MSAMWQRANVFVACRLPFAYVYISCFWIMWLLVKYYSAFVILRQRFLTSGEASINEWHEQYMQGAIGSETKQESKGVIAALKHFKQLFDPTEVMPLLSAIASLGTYQHTYVLIAHTYEKHSSQLMQSVE